MWTEGRESELKDSEAFAAAIVIGLADYLSQIEQQPNIKEGSVWAFAEVSTGEFDEPITAVQALANLLLDQLETFRRQSPIAIGPIQVRISPSQNVAARIPVIPTKLH